MPVTDLFSKRQKRSRGEVPDVYQYETIPNQLRVQIVQILEDAFGELDYNPNWGPDSSAHAFEFIHKTLCHEYGVFTLGRSHDSDSESVANFFLQTNEVEEVIDVVELSFQFLNDNLQERDKLILDEAIDELNYRFREQGVGYQYESGQIIRVDSQLIHSEVIKPALSMLSAPMYKGANAEFLSAHGHYRARRYKECLNDCLKAFESCLKTICKKRGWKYANKDSARYLIDIVFQHKLIPAFIESHFTGLRSTLEAGVPTVRNKMSSHGQGTEIISVPESIATYALHLTASNILLLARSDDEMK